jgi:hypothetical protein
MVEGGVPLTRENFIAYNWLGKPPEEWTAEHEADLPEMFRHHSAAASRSGALRRPSSFRRYIPEAGN